MKILNISLLLLILALNILPTSIVAAPSVVEDNAWHQLGKTAFARTTSGVVDIQSGVLSFTSTPIIDSESFYQKFNGDAGKAIEKSKGRIRYKTTGVNAVEVDYTLTDDRVKEIITLKKLSTLKYQISGNASLSLKSDGSIILKYGNDSVTALAPIAWNKKNQPIVTWFSLSENTITVNYIETTSNHPVYIDPTYVIQTTNEYPEAISWESSMASQPYMVPLSIPAQGLSGALTNFQFPVILTGFFNFSNTRSDGGDIRFTDGNNNELTYEIEKYDASGTSAIIWIRHPSLPANTATTAYMYFGDKSKTSVASAGAVWNQGDYNAVYHLKEATGPFLNSVTNTSDMIKGLHDSLSISGTATTGYLGQGYWFENGRSWFRSDTTGISASTRTYIISIKYPGGADSYSAIIGSRNGVLNAGIELSEVGNLVRTRNSSLVTGATSLSQNTWYNLAAIIDRGTAYGGGGAEIWSYVNGVSQAWNYSNDGENALDVPYVAAYNSSNISSTEFYVDEIRIASKKLSSNWLATDNKARANTLITIGSAQQRNASSRKQSVRATTDTWYVTYTSTTGSISGIYISQSTNNGQTWTAQAVHTTSNGWNPSIGIDSSNDLYVAWEGQGSGTFPENTNIYIKKRTAGSWGSVELVSDNNSSNILPSIAVDSSNRIYIAWSGRGYGVNTGFYNIQSRRRNTDGTYAAIVNVTDVAYDQDRGVVNMLDSDDTYMMIFEGKGWSSDVTKYGIRYSSSAGTGENIYTSAGHIKFADIAIDTRDGIHVSFVDIDSDTVRYRYRTPGDVGSWQTAEIAIIGAGDQHRSSISIRTSNNTPVIAVSGKGYGTNTSNYNVRITTGSAPWAMTTSITDVAYDNFDVSLIYHRFPVNSSIYTNIPRTGYALTFFSPTGTAEPGIKLHRSTDLTFSLPVVTTDNATNTAFRGGTSATLNGTLNSMGGSLTNSIWFDWGYGTDYGNSTPAQSVTASGTFSARISAFNPNNTIYFRAAASNPDGGVTYGDVKSFTVPRDIGYEVIRWIPAIIAIGAVIAFSTVVLAQGVSALVAIAAGVVGIISIIGFILALRILQSLW